jgi:hypothetical protein
MSVAITFESLINRAFSLNLGLTTGCPDGGIAELFAIFGGKCAVKNSPFTCVVEKHLEITLY